MQAGESLSFIIPPDELAIREEYPEQEQALTLYTFYTAVTTLLASEGETIRSLERPEEVGTVIAREGSFQMCFEDGSYLHIVPYGHEFEGEYLDLGLSITEHSEEGEYLGGYSFEMSGAELQYSAHNSPLPSDDPGYEEGKLYHFSLIDQYEHKDQLDYILIAGEEDERAYVQKALDAWKEEEDLALTSKDVGFSWRSPSTEDVLLIRGLLRMASPFKVPQL